MLIAANQMALMVKIPGTDYQLLQLDILTRYSFCIGRPTPHCTMVPCTTAHGFLVIKYSVIYRISGSVEQWQYSCKFNYKQITFTSIHFNEIIVAQIWSFALITRQRSYSFAEYWKHFVACLNAIRAKARRFLFFL